MLIDVNKIIVNERIRKDFGNIEELANDIKENGLINPPVVTPDFELIAGERRLRALKHLNYPQIEVRVMSVQDALHQLKLEISENENRKDFSFSEKMRWAEELKKEYSKIAKENMSKGGRGANICIPLGQVRDRIAEDLDMGSGENYRKAQYIYNNADKELIKKLNEGQLSINKAYTTIKEQLKAKEMENNKLKMQLENEKNKPRPIKEVVVDNTDYTLKNKLEAKEKEIKNLLQEKDRINQRLNLMTQKAEVYKKDSIEYQNMKEEITYLTKQKDDLGRQIQSVTDISGLVVEINNMLKNKLAPVKYSKSLLEARNDEIVVKNLSDIIYCVQSWVDEMKQYLPNRENYVEVI